MRYNSFKLIKILKDLKYDHGLSFCEKECVIKPDLGRIKS